MSNWRKPGLLDFQARDRKHETVPSAAWLTLTRYPATLVLRRRTILRIAADWNLPWREVVSIEGDPNWLAAQFLALCCWPRRPEKRDEFAWSLFHAGEREANRSIVGSPPLRKIKRHVRWAAERIKKGVLSAEIGRFALEPPEQSRGGIYLCGPGTQAKGRGGSVSIKRLQGLAARGFQKLAGLELKGVKEGDDNMQRVWREFRPALPQLMALASCRSAPDRFAGLPVNDPTLLIVNASSWIDRVLAESVEIALDLHQELGIPAEELILCGPAGSNLLPSTPHCSA